MRLVYFLIVAFISTDTGAQEMILRDPVTNKVFNYSKYADVNGSPFLLDKWIRGAASIAKGTYNDLELKLDVYGNILLFKREEQPFEFQDDVLSFILKPVITDSTSYLYFKKGITAQGLQSNQYVQVLTEGKVSLYKSEKKSLAEVNQINKGVVQSFSSTVRYYLVKEGIAHLIKLNKTEILNVLSDQQEKINAFINTQKLTLKREADVIKVIQFYNSL